MVVYQYTAGLLLSLFSSRRRHTSWPRDWSSDVCSSDLAIEAGCGAVRVNPGNIRKFDDKVKEIAAAASDAGVSQIGRASCRERDKISLLGVLIKEQRKIKHQQGHSILQPVNNKAK